MMTKEAYKGSAPTITATFATSLFLALCLYCTEFLGRKLLWDVQVSERNDGIAFLPKSVSLSDTLSATQHSSSFIRCWKFPSIVGFWRVISLSIPLVVWSYRCWVGGTATFP